MAAPPGAPDTDGMWAATAGLPEQMAAGALAAQGRAVAATPSSLSSIVALGMGGSGIGNDILAAVAGPLCPLPIVVGKDYELPAFVGPSTLVFAASFSGTTEETLSAVTAGLERGAPTVAITTGGALADLVSAAGGAVITVAPGIPHPRAAIGAMTVAPIVVLAEMGLLDGGLELIDQAIAQLRIRRDALEAEGDRSVAAVTARGIGRTIPLIYGGGAIGRAAALRWKGQINENPKTPAFWAAHPELCHNELTGWGQLGDVTRQVITLVDLRHDFEHPQVRRRFALVDEIMDEVVSDIVTVQAAGTGSLAQLFDLVLLADYTALWMCAREGLDPGPIPVLSALKDSLRGT